MKGLTPSVVRPDVNAILGDGGEHGLHVALEVLDPVRVLDRLINRQQVLILDREAVLGAAADPRSA